MRSAARRSPPARAKEALIMAARALLARIGQ